MSRFTHAVRADPGSAGESFPSLATQISEGGLMDEIRGSENGGEKRKEGED